jgi:ketosteroid isomerase-like protein
MRVGPGADAGGQLPVSGTWKGPAGIIDGFLAQMTRTLDASVPVAVEVRNLIADGDQAMAEWTSRARSKDGRPYENDYSVVFRVSGGKIVEVREYLDTLYVSQVLFPGSPVG